MSKVGVITEQGDLVLGFDPLNSKDQKVYNESVKAADKEKKEADKNQK